MPAARTPGPMAIFRNEITRAVRLAAVGMGLLGCSDTVAPPPPAQLKAGTVAASDQQTGVVGEALPLPLQVLVDSGGIPVAGVIVHWHARSGSLATTESTTDGRGVAQVGWTLGSGAGYGFVDATIAGTQPSSLTFRARGVPGPAVAIGIASGSDQTLPANHSAFAPLIAFVIDRYGNHVEGQAVAWTVVRGPVGFLTTGGVTDAAGKSTSVLAPSGTTGEALVQAELPGLGQAEFALTVTAATFGVVLHTCCLLSDPYGFQSSQNGSRNPAVDTIPAGGTMEWTLEFDYDQHGVAAVGTPSFESGDFPYADDPIVSVTFTTPGTYHYTDPYHPTATGIVVVR